MSKKQSARQEIGTLAHTRVNESISTDDNDDSNDDKKKGENDNDNDSDRNNEIHEEGDSHRVAYLFRFLNLSKTSIRSRLDMPSAKRGVSLIFIDFPCDSTPTSPLLDLYSTLTRTLLNTCGLVAGTSPSAIVSYTLATWALPSPSLDGSNQRLI